MMSPSKQLLNWPNLLTLGRLLLIPLFVLFYYLPYEGCYAIATAIFMLGCFTDWLDGYLARYLKQTTPLGAFLDPVADKLIVSIALVLIVAEPIFSRLQFNAVSINLPAAVISIPAAVIVARELIVSALRELMAELGKRASVAVSHLGKIKTTVQMLALTVLLACKAITLSYLILTGIALLYLAAILTIWSMFYYLQAAWRQLNSLDS